MKHFILGTDWWTDCDDAVALRLLSSAHARGEIRLSGIVLNACMPHSVPSVDGFLGAAGIRDIPLGIDLAATDFGGRPPYQAKLAPLAERYRRNEDAEDAVSLYRRLLAAADGPVEIIEIGFLQAAAALLLSAPDEFSPLTGVELVRRKVARFWVMAGKWDEEGGKEHNFALNPRSRAGGADFCRLCPVPVTFLGFEIGADVKSGGGLPQEDVLAQVLRDHGSASGRSSWDPMTVLLALIGDEDAAGYTYVQGTARVDPGTGANHFVPDETGLHRYVIKARPNEWYADQINSRL